MFPEEFMQSAKRNIEKIDQSRIFFSLYSEDCPKDISVMIQMGAAIMMGKPIALLALRGVKISEHLLNIAFHIEYLDKPDAESIQTASKKILDAAKARGMM